MSLDITGDLIKSAIAREIVADFKVDNKPPVVYKEQVKQGFVYPSFFIYQVNMTQTKRMNNVYDRLYLMEVRYALKEDDVNAYSKLDEIGNQLCLTLNEINVPIAIGQDNGAYIEGTRAIRVKGEINLKKDENVLMATMTYPVTIIQFSDNVKFKSIIHNERII